VIGEAVNGVEALDKVQSLRPDVVLMDIRMPEMDGVEATRRIQEQCPTPVVILTAHDKSDLVEAASESGAGAYLVKPPNGHAMERAITVAMARFEDMMELRRLNDELRSRNEDLDAFAHTVAHDLKNSLALISGYAEIIRRHYETLSVEDVMDHIHSIEESGERASRITDQLLMLSKTRWVKPEKMTSLDMSSIVAEARKSLKGMIEKNQAEINLPENWPKAVGHAPWVEVVWANYMSNAIKYGGNPPRMTLGADVRENQEDSPPMVRFWVQDYGAGLTSEEQAKLFKPFAKLDKREEGYGLGLSIVWRIVEKLGGEVGVESQVGQGSKFFFTLPAAEQKPA
jgi:signal transduction histidine kinase